MPVVVMHDAARPLVTAATIEAVIARARAGQAAIAALPLVDTLKEVDEDGHIVRTIDARRGCGAPRPRRPFRGRFSMTPTPRRDATASSPPTTPPSVSASASRSSSSVAASAR